uniref:Uncharacterized protein n=1 Tax=Romanomermis culicivorax TaxID=13658 RepID=A0A915IFV7_ROMCU
MQKCDAEIINFCVDATNVLHEIVTLAMQQQQLLEQYKLQMEELEEKNEKCMKGLKKKHQTYELSCSNSVAKIIKFEKYCLPSKKSAQLLRHN